MNWEGFERVYGDSSWDEFKKKFPGADFSQFKEVNGDVIFKKTGEVLYRKGDLQEETLKHILAHRHHSPRPMSRRPSNIPYTPRSQKMGFLRM